MTHVLDHPSAAPAAERSPRSRRARRGARALVAVAAVVTLAAACMPGDFVKHQAGPYWVWFGPKSWVESHSTYGIDISSPNGDDAVAHTFNTVICTAAPDLATSVSRYFPNRRAQVKSGSGLTGFVFTNISNPRKLNPSQYGVNYFRQDVSFQGTNARGVVIQGEANLDYALPDTTYCFERLKYRATPKNRFATSMPRLQSVQDNIIYSGPGACDPDHPSDPCPG